MPLYLGLDIGGTKYTAVVGDEHGTVLTCTSARSPQAKQHKAVHIADLLLALIETS